MAVELSAAAQDTQGGAQSAPAAAQVAPQPERPSERVQLASFGEALEKATSSGPKADDKATGDGGRAPKPSGDGESTDQVSKPAPVRDSQPKAAAADPKSGEPAETALKPDEEEVAGEPTEQQAGKPAEGGTSRRGAAKRVEELEAENAALKSKVVDVPAEVLSQLETLRLPDAKFSALEEKLKRESLTGEYLTDEEREAYNTALTLRSWFAPVYKHALGNAEEWAKRERQQIFDDQAKDLAPILRDRPYVDAKVIGAASSWAAIYTHIADASLAEGQRLKSEELQPKLDEAKGRIADLEAQLAGLRPRSAGQSRPLERGGLPSGGASGRPNLGAGSSASDIFAAAIAETEARRSRRAS